MKDELYLITIDFYNERYNAFGDFIIIIFFYKRIQAPDRRRITSQPYRIRLPYCPRLGQVGSPK